MIYTIDPEPKVEAIFRKMWKKDSARFGQIEKKLLELSENPETGKPLKQPLKGFWRLHIGHYVLIYKIDKKNQKITLVDYTHHDEAY
ncbi:MAG: type II toxin-antitoxin system RelE/ParE family toxin [Methanoregula sp.]|jgi:addiction module RelE/StbE family toxin|nr:type II toxin-antitoxin system RelE/ParE family toxin [Methanoregula sp.]